MNTRTPEHAARNSELAEYLRQIRGIPLLTPEEEIELVARLQKGGCEHSRERLVCGNLRLAVYIAKRYAGLGVPLQDLVEAANVGLLLAVERFDPSRRTRFATYAQWWMRRSIFNTLSENGRLIRLPPNARRARRACREAVERLHASLGRTATRDEVARETGLSASVVSAASAPGTLSLHGAPEDGSRPGSDIPDRAAEPVDETAVKREQQERLQACLPTLPEQEAKIVRLHFGLGGQESHTVREIARKLGLADQHVQHLLRAGLARLSVMLRGEPAHRNGSALLAS